MIVPRESLEGWPQTRMLVKGHVLDGELGVVATVAWGVVVEGGMSSAQTGTRMS